MSFHARTHNDFFRTKLVLQYTRIPVAQFEHKVLTGQSVRAEHEVLHSRAAPQLRRDCTCAARRSFLGCCKLVLKKYTIAIKRVSSARTDQLILVEVEFLQLRELPNLGRDCTCQHIFSHKATHCIDAHLAS